MSDLYLHCRWQNSSGYLGNCLINSKLHLSHPTSLEDFPEEYGKKVTINKFDKLKVLPCSQWNYGSSVCSGSHGGSASLAPPSLAFPPGDYLVLRGLSAICNEALANHSWSYMHCARNLYSFMVIEIMYSILD